MLFTDFIERLAKVLQGGSNTARFTRTVFQQIIPEDKYSVIEYKDSSFKGFFNGYSSIRKISHIIYDIADPQLFAPWIYEHGDYAVEKLCEEFKDIIPDINLHNAGDKIANLFSEIINEAATSKGKTPQALNKRNETTNVTVTPVIIKGEKSRKSLNDELLEASKLTGNEQITNLVSQMISEATNPQTEAPQKTNAGNRTSDEFNEKLIDKCRDNVIKRRANSLSQDNAVATGSIIAPKDGIIIRISDDAPLLREAFKKYLKSATEFYSTKKTLLYAEKPIPFYDMYVCNDIEYKEYHIPGTRFRRMPKTISNATISELREESDYLIIQGLGGIGKSMLMTHLFLSSADKVDITGQVPLLLSLKNYKDSTNGMVEFILNSVKEYDPSITEKEIRTALECKLLVLLLDGLDEIQSLAKNNFNESLEALIKAYPGNQIVMTSRPIYSFITYQKFTVFDIKELSKSQAIELIEKLEFWDSDSQKKFLCALDENLYVSHRQFASNPLLLTIMLMTYSSFGEIPAKMHIFYDKAYETMARLHDATKGAFVRPLHTGLTPEEFAKVFSQFCARTYEKEVLEFDVNTFSSYMDKVLKKTFSDNHKYSSRDFLLDLTENLCIMYREGSKYYFIHRSFQEYFAALYFSSEYDSRLCKVGEFFENKRSRSLTDKTFDMLYDMIPNKVERYIFLPFLEKLLSTSSINDVDAYWDFLENIYPYLYYEKGVVGEHDYNEATSFLYDFLVKIKGLELVSELDTYEWTAEIDLLPTKNWADVYERFTESYSFNDYPDPDSIPDRELEWTTVVEEDSLPYEYSEYFGPPVIVGSTTEIEIYNLRSSYNKYYAIIQQMENPDFPLFREYQNVKRYYISLKESASIEDNSDDLFDD